MTDKPKFIQFAESGATNFPIYDTVEVSAPSWPDQPDAKATVEIDPAEAKSLGYDGGVARLIDGEWVITETFSYDDGPQRTTDTQVDAYRVSATAVQALINRGYLVRRGDHEALATTLRDAVAWLRYVHEGAMTKALLHNVYDCDICQFIERWS